MCIRDSCKSYNSWTSSCARLHGIDYRSYIEYECDMAVQAGIDIVVLYNSARVNLSKCPLSVRYEKKHIAMKRCEYGELKWDYYAVKNALQ